MNRILYTEVSGNKKTGPIPVTTSEAQTCPDACPFKTNGCYAKYGPIMIHWNRLNKGETGIAWKDFIGKITRLWTDQLWRHNQAGDLAQKNGVIDAPMLAELTKANKRKRGFTYTHHEVLTGKHAKANRKAIAAANKGGFTVNLSGNNPEHADKLKALGIAPVVTVVAENTPNTSFTPAGNKVIVCPAIYRENVNCAHCGLCQRADRSVIIGFRPHGSGRKYVEAKAAA